jgi:hypothetical protein
VARPAKTFIAEIGPELAVPFAEDYCVRHELPFLPGDQTWWAGAFVSGALRAVMGVSSLGSMGMLISGVFHDDSDEAFTACRMFVERLTEMPCDLYGSLHLPTERARSIFRKKGWTLLQGVETCLC